MSLIPVLASALPILATFIGGFVVMRWKKDLHPWLSLSGGLLLGIAFIDLLPEAFDYGRSSGMDTSLISGISLIAILIFHILDKTVSLHAHHDHASDHHPEEACYEDRHRGTHAYVRAVSMMIHGGLDGVVVGAGFVIDPRLGLLVTTAIIAHAFSDGMSTVTVLRQGLGRGHRLIAPLFALVSLSPFVGALLGMRLGLQSQTISAILAFIAGFFIFLSLSDLLPQAHSGKLARRHALLLTALGVMMIVFFRFVTPE